jgi:hypothetical protein
MQKFHAADIGRRVKQGNVFFQILRRKVTETGEAMRRWSTKDFCGIRGIRACTYIHAMSPDSDVSGVHLTGNLHLRVLIFGSECG